MTGRRAVLAAMALLLPPVAAVAQQAAPPPAPAQPAARSRARPRRRAAPPPPPPEPPASVSRGDPAPVPNRDLEGPRQATTQRTTPQINPALIDPAEPQIGTSRDAASLQTREDRLLRQPAAGARLRLPFGY